MGNLNKNTVEGEGEGEGAAEGGVCGRYDDAFLALLNCSCDFGKPALLRDLDA